MTNVGTLFDDGAVHFERLAPTLWNTMGNAVVAAADLRVGEHVLDACCGSGAGTIPAAQVVGPEGRIDAVDLSSELLALAAAKAAALDLHTITFANADVSAWTSEKSYDAVLCGYGLFFLPDMADGTRHLAAQLRSGGKFAMSTWHEHAHEPFASLLRDVCVEEQPHLLEAAVPRPIRQMAEISSVEKLRAFLQAAGFESIEVHEAPLQIPLDADLAWALVLGTGYRFLLPSDADSRERVRTRFLAKLGENFTFNADSLIAIAVRR
ncbi:class I SAM-dependent methyltransferase [uncultured Arthrobacter sp.]|uniref:class I SAM-dependent methyltransferase n=1 Tax=uncultured Arthrobacter sp. TaxID=114050 RepID=UPI00260FE51F|nr:methyltransferase domain-containing protein [uncultured Arthrobacter sp.]